MREQERRVTKLQVTFIIDALTDPTQKNLLLGTKEENMQIIVNVDETGIAKVEMLLAHEEEKPNA